MIFTVHSAAPGWAAFGIGDRMSDIPLYIGWMNSTGGYTITSSKSSGYSQPVSIKSQDITIVSLNVTKPSWSKVSFSFSRPINGSTSITSKSKYVFAYSNAIPNSIDNFQSSFSVHRVEGGISAINFLTSIGSSGVGSISKPIIGNPPSIGYEAIIKIHGTLMFVAWAVIPFM